MSQVRMCRFWKQFIKPLNSKERSPTFMEKSKHDQLDRSFYKILELNKSFSWNKKRNECLSKFLSGSQETYLIGHHYVQNLSRRSTFFRNLALSLQISTINYLKWQVFIKFLCFTDYIYAFGMISTNKLVTKLKH